MSLIGAITSSKLFCKMEMMKWSAEDKVKDAVDYVKENPGKVAAKVATNIAVNTILPGGTVIKEAGKLAAKKAAGKYIDKLD